MCGESEEEPGGTSGWTLRRVRFLMPGVRQDKEPRNPYLAAPNLDLSRPQVNRSTGVA
jgi:hypothetical protein